MAIDPVDHEAYLQRLDNELGWIANRIAEMQVEAADANQKRGRRAKKEPAPEWWMAVMGDLVDRYVLLQLYWLYLRGLLEPELAEKFRAGVKRPDEWDSTEKGNVLGSPAAVEDLDRPRDWLRQGIAQACQALHFDVSALTPKQRDLVVTKLEAIVGQKVSRESVRKTVSKIKSPRTEK